MRNFSLIIATFFIFLNVNAVYAETPSRQAYLDSSALLAQNYELLLDLDTGNTQGLKVAGTLIADMNAAIGVVELYENFRASSIIAAIDDLEDQANILTQNFSRLGVAEMDDQIITTISQIEDLSQQKTLYQQNLRNIAGLKSRIASAHTFFSRVGNTLGVIDTGLKARTYIETLRSDAGQLEQFQAEGDFVLSAAITSLAIAAPNALPPVAIVSAATATTAWYTDKLGDVVRDGTESRSSIYASTISNAGLTIQNTILRGYNSGSPLSESEISQLVNETYSNVRDEIESYRGDIGAMERFFGLSGVEEDAIDRAIFLVDTILDGRGVDRAIRYDSELRDNINIIERFNESLSEAVDIAQLSSDDNISELRINAQNRSLEEADNVLLYNAQSWEDDSSQFSQDRESNDVEPVLGNNAGTNIEIQPTGPTPEEIAEAERLAEEERLAAIAEAERLAELRRQEIARLEIERTAQFEVKLAREVQIQNLDNELALLEFGDQQEVQNALSLVTGEEQRLRAELNDTGLSAADQQLLQDLLVYQETLEDELDRISGRISSLESQRDTLQSELDSANTVIIANSDQLNALDYDYNQFTEPTTSEELIDWSDYDYELPTFDPTELLTSDLSNVVGHAVSVPVVNGNNRVEIDLVAEDNTILDLGIPGAITELEDESGDLLDGFTHLYLGGGVDENGDDSQWIYGEAATPEQFALRTGTATFNGGLSGYYAHGSVSDHTLYQDGVSGSLALEVDFGTNRITGEGEIEIDTAVRSETLTFSLDESTISETDSGLTRSLGFSANATLENESGVSGNLGGTFYGEDASEAAGSFAFDLGTGFSAGLWAAGENYEPTEDGDYPVIVSYSDLNGGITDRGDPGIGKIPELGDNLTLTIDGTATTVTSVSNVQAGDFDYTSMGQWTGGAPSSPINTGYWLAGEATPISGIDVRTGSATFAGNIIGDYVPFSLDGDVEREDATGTIQLTADFSQDQIDGEMQFVSSNHASEIIPLSSPISDTGYYFQTSDGSTNSLGFGYGFSGTFFGPNATETGGSVWAATDVGNYNGVFRAGEGLSFGGFVTPTTTDTTNPSDPTDYSNYRGLAAYAAFDADDASFPVSTDFVALDTINSTPKAFFENTSVSTNVVASTDTLGQSYIYTNWGAWDNDGSALVDGVAGRDVAANWIVYDPTTDLRTTGQATYNGDAVGLTSDLQDVSGNIQLTADFANDTVTGNMSLSTSNGQSWADASFDTTIRRDTDSSGFQGALTGTDVNSGVIFGGFAGPNAEEVGGGWQIDNANGTDGVGIFRAQN